MQAHRHITGAVREKNKTQSSSVSAFSLTESEKLSVMEALDHMYVTRQYQAMGSCVVCKKISVKTCSGCKMFYCSSECQTFDWPRHKSTCSYQRDSLSDRSSFGSAMRMRCSTGKNFSEEPFMITDRSSPFTVLTTQLSRKSRSMVSDSKNIANYKIGNEQYRNREVHPKRSEVGSMNETKDPKKGYSNGRRKNSSPRKSSSSKKSSPEDKKASEKNHKNSKNHHQGDKMLKSIENIPHRDSHTPSEKSQANSHSHPLQTGQVEVIAMFRESLNKYWVMAVSNLEKYEEIQAALNSEWKNYDSVKPKIGLVCGCTFADEWFRGKIISLDPDITVHFIDYGNTSNYDSKAFKKLPEKIQLVPGLVFPIEFEEGTPAKYKTRDLVSLKFTVEETGKTGDGVSRVKVIEGIYGSTISLEKPPQKKKDSPRKVKSVMDIITANSNGMLFFLPGKGTVRFASIVPDNNKDANDSIEKILNIDGPNTPPLNLRAKVGDYVLVADKEGNDQRGQVLLWVGSRFYVRLIDCGTVISSENVYPLPEELADLIELGVKVTVEEVVSQEQMKDLETCFFTVKGEAISGKWPCTLRGTEQQIIAQVLLEKPEEKLDWKPKYVHLQSGATVEITTVSFPNSFYVRPVDAEMEQKFLDMNMELHQFSLKAKNYSTPPTPGELCCAKFAVDSCFYRAIINSVESEKASVFFVDFGNEQETDLSDIKPLPRMLKTVPFFAVKVDLINVSNKQWNNMMKDYIGKLISDNVELTLTCESIRKGVTLREKVSGVVVNDFMEKAAGKPTMDSLPVERPLPVRGEIYLDDDMKYTEPSSSSPFTLAILYVSDYEFQASQTFWATVAGVENFNYVNVELSSMICEHCERVSTPYEPTYRELCLAEFEGSWYRAICAGNTDGIYKVFFVDFGNCCELESKSIRKIQKEFLKAPALAMNCTLSGRKKLKEDPELTKEICKKLLDRINTFIEGVTVKNFEEDTYVLEIPEIESILGR